MKKFLIFLLLALCIVPMSAQATSATDDIISSGSCGENLTWTLDYDGLLTISGTGDMINYGPSYAENISVPWSGHRADIKMVVIESGVTSIGNNAFVACADLTKVIMCDTITRIGEHVFENCFRLTQADIPASVTEIGEYAFGGCKALTSVVIPSGITEIADYCFESCVGLTDVVIPEGVSSIGHCAFKYCPSLTKIVIPTSITSIGRNAFEECENLGHILYTGTQEQWNAITLRYGAIGDNVGITYDYIDGMPYHSFANDCAAKCNHCSYTREADHAWDEGITEGNVVTFTCAVCGDTMQDYIENVDPVYPPYEDESSQPTKPSQPCTWPGTLPTQPTSATSSETRAQDGPNSGIVLVAVIAGFCVAVAVVVIVIRKKK